MPLITPIKPGDWNSVELAFRQVTKQLGPKAAAAFEELVLTNLQAGRLVASDLAGKLVSTTAGQWILEGSGIILTDNGDGTVTVSITEGGGGGIVEVADAAARQASTARVVYQQDTKKLYMRRG